MMFVWFAFALPTHAGGEAQWAFETGDVIGQTSLSGQGPLVQLGTMSKYSHVGVVVMFKGKPYVLEATSTVKYTTLKNFLKKGKDEKYTVLRYHKKDKKDPKKTKIGLTKKEKSKLIRKAKKYMGKKYDLAFRWSNHKMYCSELVWKLYDDIGLEASHQNTMRGFNLWIPPLKKVMERRWGGKGKINLDEIVVAPSDIMRSKNLKLVYSNYLFE